MPDLDEGSARDSQARLLSAVKQVMEVQDVSIGGPGIGYAFRFRGRLLWDSQQAYDSLEPHFRKEGLTLLFRRAQNLHVVLAMPGLIQPRPSNPRVNLLLFLATVPSVLLAGLLYAGDPGEVGGLSTAQVLWSALPGAIAFTASLLAILLAHEFGHYLAARSHRSPVTLPYFLPFPGSLLGTLGAFIQLKAPPRNRRALLDIGLAGPLAGLAVALPVLIVGLSLSEVSTLPARVSEGSGLVLEGNSLLYLGLKYAVTGEWLPRPADFGSASPGLYWLRYFFSGLPVPFGGQDVTLHPMAWAGWAGLMVTALNLIPAGQLDGGHALYVLLGDRASQVWPFLVVGLAVLGLVWPGWWLWAALIFFLGRVFAQPLDDITPLDPRRKALAIAGIILFALVFTPVPLRSVMGA